MKSFFLFAITCVLSQNLFALGSFDVEQYIEKCGGKIYPSCDSPQLNQLTIYKEAEEKAIASNKKVILIVGADWCPPCQHLNETLKSHPEAIKEMEQQFVIVELSGDYTKTKSSNDLTDYLNIFVPGYPTVYKIDPTTQTNNMVRLRSYTDIESIKSTMVEVNTDTSLLEEVKNIEHIGNIPLSALDVPVDLDENFGQYPYFKSKAGLIFRSETEADKYVNAGLARFNLFHYIDAARCFKQALKIDSDNAMAKAFLAMAYLNMGNSYDVMKLANVLVGTIDASSLSGKEKVWLNFAKSYVYSQAGKLVEDTYSDGLHIAYDKLSEKLGEDDTEVATLATYLVYGASSADTFNNALQEMPKNAAAYHYLVHFYENSLAYYQAEEAAVQLSELASDSAHAQHMLGHIAPRLKKWDLAETQFLKASKIHTNWANKYGYPEHYDWHYSHNMDLMGSVYVGLHQEEKALDLFVKSCRFDSRACFAALKLGAYLGTMDGFNKLEEMFGKSVFENEYYANTFAFLRVETDIENILSQPNKDEIFKSLVEIPGAELEGVELLLKKVLESYLTDTPLNIEISAKVSLYAEDRLGCASFDGWGKGMLDLMRLIKFSSALGFPEIEKQVNKLLDSGLGIEFDYSSNLNFIPAR